MEPSIIIERHYIPASIYRELYRPNYPTAPRYIPPPSFSSLFPTVSTTTTTATATSTESQPFPNQSQFENMMNYANPVDFSLFSHRTNTANTNVHPILAGAGATVISTTTLRGENGRGVGIVDSRSLTGSNQNINNIMNNIIRNVINGDNRGENIPVDIEINNIPINLMTRLTGMNLRGRRADTDQGSTGMTPAEINRISEVIKYGDFTNSNVEQQCSICQGEFINSDMCRRLTGCMHIFHLRCIDIWLSDKNTCPTCRHNLFEDLEYNGENSDDGNDDDTNNDDDDETEETSGDDVEESTEENEVTVEEVVESSEDDEEEIPTRATSGLPSTEQVNNFIESDGFTTFINYTTPIINDVLSSNVSPSETRNRVSSLINSLITNVNPFMTSFEEFINTSRQSQQNSPQFQNRFTRS